MKAAPSGKLFLSFKEPTQSLRDILESALMIEDFTLGMSFEQFREDPKTVAAVERKFLVMAEARAMAANPRFA